MYLKNMMSMLNLKQFFTMMRIMKDWKSIIRFYFLHAAMETGLLSALNSPHTLEELVAALGAVHKEYLIALLEVGLSIKELKKSGQRYSLKGARSRALANPEGDAWAAVIQANVTYYNSAYYHLSSRMKGNTPKGDYLEHISPIVARFSKLTEPILNNFLTTAVKHITKANGKTGLSFMDIGTGSGIFLKSVAQMDPESTGVGIEMDNKVVSQANTNLIKWGLEKRFKAVTGNILSPETYKRYRYDLISFFNIAYYFSSKERVSIFHHMKSILRDHGALVIAGNMASKGIDFGAANLNIATTSIKGCTPLPAIEEILGELESAGFNQIKPVCFFPKGTFYGVIAESN